MEYKVIDTSTQDEIGKVYSNKSLSDDEVMELAGFEFEYSEAWQAEGWSNDGNTIHIVGESCEIVTE